MYTQKEIDEIIQDMDHKKKVKTAFRESLSDLEKSLEKTKSLLGEQEPSIQMEQLLSSIYNIQSKISDVELIDVINNYR